jgi:cytochrome P450
MSRVTAWDKTLHARDTTYTVPAGTQIWIVNARMQYDREAWGPDHLAFRPSRFTDSSGPEAEQAQRRHFLPWSRGPRQCPGMKIAQIEFVSLVATIFSRARVACAPLSGETAEAAAARTMRVIRDSSPVLSMQVNRPKEVVVVWKKRG